LSYLDSNQDRQNQKLQCYHYTIRQSYVLRACALKSSAKLISFFRFCKRFAEFLFEIAIVSQFVSRFTGAF
jgi:hypothetical protein